MLVQCTARRLHALKVSSILLKLDITKVFDSIQWLFLLEVLRKMGFGPRWISWICGLLAHSSTSIMVNGVLGRTIYNYQGLRQGAPLSPMLFILCMEPLQRLFDLAANRGLLSPLARSSLKQRVSMFANDVMVLLKPVDIELRTCTRVLEMYGEASGLRVNADKRMAIPIRCSDEDSTVVMARLGCPIGSFPCK